MSSVQVLYAHQDMFVSVHRENVYVQFSLGWDEFELDEHAHILLEMANKWFLENEVERVPVFIEFIHDYAALDSARATIRYGTFEFSEFEEEKYIRRTYEGVVISVKDTQLVLPEILNMLAASVDELGYIKENMQRYPPPRYSKDSVMSIPPDRIEMYQSRSDPSIETLLQHKFFRNQIPSVRPLAPDYYVQGGQVHFYNIGEPTFDWRLKPDKGVYIDSLARDILIVPSVLEIIGSEYDGHLIFIDDSTFYYFPMLKDTVIGPMWIKGMRGARQPILTYQEKGGKLLTRFMFDVYTYGADRYRSQTVLVVPDSAFVMSDYDPLETAFIQDLIEQEKSRAIHENDWSWLVIIFFAVGIILGGFWMYLQRSATS